MAFNSKTLEALKHPVDALINGCNPDPNKAGNILLYINAAGMAFAALSNTFAAAIDKNTSAEDKKFLVPAGLATGVANIGVYFAITTKVIDKLKASAEKTIKEMKPEELTKKTKEFIDGRIAKVGKKSAELAEEMKKLYKDGDGVTEAAKEFYKDNTKAAVGVAGAFFGAVVGCAIITPIIRDVSAYFVQKNMEKKNPKMKEEPYK